jgi:hypothetical protein
LIRIIYIEASRGCPFTREICLSPLDVPVRQTALPVLLDHLQRPIFEPIVALPALNRKKSGSTSPNCLRPCCLRFLLFGNFGFKVESSV